MPPEDDELNKQNQDGPGVGQSLGTTTTASDGDSSAASNPGAQSSTGPSASGATDTNVGGQSSTSAPILSGGGADTSGKVGGPTQGSTGNASNSQQSGDSLAPTSSGSFTNLQSYLDANKDSGLNDQLAGKVNDEASQASNNLDQFNQNFQGQVNNGYIAEDKQGVSGAIDAANNGAVTADQATAFQKQLNDQYAGPNQYSLDQNVSNQLGNASGDVGSLGNANGQYALLQKFFNQPNYNQGQQNLDQLIVSNGPQTAFQNTQQQYTGLGSAADTSQQNGQNAITQGQQNALQANTDARAALGVDASGNQLQTAGQGAYGNLNSALTGQMTADQAADANTQQQYNQSLQNVQNTVANVNGLGINNINMGNLQGDFSYSGPQNLNQDSAGNAAQQAQLAALGQLSGNAYTQGPAYQAAVGNINSADIGNQFQNSYNNELNNSNYGSQLVKNAQNQDFLNNPVLGPNGSTLAGQQQLLNQRGQIYSGPGGQNNQGYSQYTDVNGSYQNLMHQIQSAYGSYLPNS